MFPTIESGRLDCASVHDGDHDGVHRIFVGLPECYTANDSEIGHLSNGEQQEDKKLRTPLPR